MTHTKKGVSKMTESLSWVIVLVAAIVGGLLAMAGTVLFVSLIEWAQRRRRRLHW